MSFHVNLDNHLLLFFPSHPSISVKLLSAWWQNIIFAVRYLSVFRVIRVEACHFFKIIDHLLEEILTLSMITKLWYRVRGTYFYENQVHYQAIWSMEWWLWSWGKPCLPFFGFCSRICSRLSSALEGHPCFEQRVLWAVYSPSWLYPIPSPCQLGWTVTSG